MGDWDTVQASPILSATKLFGLRAPFPTPLVTLAGVWQIETRIYPVL